MSSTAITTTTPGQMAESYSQDQVKLIRDTFAKGASESEFQLFLAVAAKKGLDILSRQIHLVKRWDAKAQREVCEIQTGIDGYRLIADRTGRYEGQSGPFWCGADGQWVDVWLATEPPRAAKVGVWRAGCREPFWGVALFSEYCQTYKDKSSGQTRPNPMWARMPAAQLAKCAEALALRKAFPAEMSGIYTSEEMGQASNVIDVTPSAVAAPAPTPTPAPAPKKAPRAISAAPAPVVAAVDTGLVEQLSQILDGLAGYDVADALILKGIAKITGQTLTDLSTDSIALLSPDELETLIKRYGTRLEQLKAERAGQPDRHAFDEPTVKNKKTPMDPVINPSDLKPYNPDDDNDW
jgi:phage recombination protein Bet